MLTAELYPLISLSENLAVAVGVAAFGVIGVVAVVAVVAVVTVAVVAVAAVAALAALVQFSSVPSCAKASVRRGRLATTGAAKHCI